MAKKKSKYRDVESMTDEEFEALTREIAGPRMELNEPQCDPRYTERHDNPTPSGGDYSVAFYYDEDHNPCPVRRHGTSILLSILLMELESTSIME